MSLGYQAIFALDSSPNVQAITGQYFAEWLAGRLKPIGLGQSLDENFIQEIEDGSIGVVRVDTQVAQGSLFTLREKKDGRDWKTNVYALEQGTQSGHSTIVVQVSVSHAENEDPIDLLDPPALARQILSSEMVFDGSSRILPTARFLESQEQVVELVAELTSDARNITINVAPSPGDDLNTRWLDLLNDLTKKSAGNSSTYVISEDLIPFFNSLMGSEFGSPRGTVRSYLPGVNLRNPEDSLRHRYLKTRTITDAQKIDRSGRPRISLPLTKAFNYGARQRLLTSESVASFRESIKILDAYLDLAFHEYRVSKATASDRIAGVTDFSAFDKSDANVNVGNAVDSLPKSLVQRLASFFRKLTGREELSENAIDELERKVASIADDATEYKKLAEDYAREAEEYKTRFEIELAESQTQERRAKYLEYENRTLRRQTKEITQPDYSEKFNDLPGTMEKLVERLDPEFGDQEWSWLRETVIFTGMKKEAQILDTKDMRERYLQRAWDFVRVMHDYVLASRSQGIFNGDMDSYLSNTSQHEGFTTSQVNHAPTESREIRTTEKYRSLRIFPVPKEVSPFGHVPMWAHFKLNTSDNNAPRIYYLDDTKKTGKLYIGYVGVHLLSPMTN